MKLGCTWRHDLMTRIKAGSPFPSIFGKNFLSYSSYCRVGTLGLKGTRSCKSPCHDEEDCFNPTQKQSTSWSVISNNILIHDSPFLWSGCFSQFPWVTLWHLSVLFHQMTPMCQTHHSESSARASKLVVFELKVLMFFLLGI